MLTAQCDGYRVMTTSAFRLVSYKPHFHYAIVSATGYELQGKRRLNLWHKGNLSIIVQQKRKSIVFLFSLVAIGSYS